LLQLGRVIARREKVRKEGDRGERERERWREVRREGG
jgi:hypothetical protein